ncbi:MAG: transglycosylase domain-containing protein, partial [Chloroflexota bacterium]
MPSSSKIPEIISRRRKTAQKNNGSLLSLLKGGGIGLITLLSLVLAVGVVWGAINFSQISADLPAIEQLPILLNPSNGHLTQATQLYDRSGKTLLLTLENPKAEKGVYIQFDDIPDVVINAALAASDPDFWQHDGAGTANAQTFATRLVSAVLLDDYLGQNSTLRQNFLAAQVTNQYGREQVAEWFLNYADYGQGAFGIDQAAQVYFDKPAQEITLAESAILAAIIDAAALNPIDAPEIAIQRQNEVLQAMQAAGSISPEQAASANNEPIRVQPAVPQPETQTNDFVRYALQQLFDALGETRVRMGGYRVRTTIDLSLQHEITCTSAIQLERLRGESSLTSLPENECAAARLLPTLASDAVDPQSEMQANVVVLNPQNGQILALFGDAGGGRPPGTILSPFVYLTGFTRGLNPASLVWDIPSNIPNNLFGFGNADGLFYGPMQIRTALANDYLAPVFETLTEVGANNVWRITQQSGFQTLELPKDTDSFRLLLDSGNINLVEAVHAFGMLSNNGVLAGQGIGEDNDEFIPTAIISVTDPAEKKWINWAAPQSQPVASAQLAYLLTDILSDEQARRKSLGHPNVLETGIPSAVKLGRTSDNANLWTIGYSPQRVVGVWLGNRGVTANSPEKSLAAAGLWNGLFKFTHETLDFQSFKEPIGLNRINVCSPSGLLPTADCPQIVTELFMPGNEPIQTDNLYHSFLINRQTNLLATVYTPPEYVEERTYLVVPPEAAEWAQLSGIELAPTSYDVIFNPANKNPNVHITQPEVFGYISGAMDIVGSANGDSFSLYRIQIGEGLNPRQWLQIGEDFASPVNNSRLASWDTTGLDGLYALQLIMVNEDQSIETDILQITVDNKAPQVQINNLVDGQVFSYPTEQGMTFMAQVQDNLQVARVEFYLDDKKIATLTSPPYITPWQGTLGQHKVRVAAYDLASNLSEVEISFS